MFAEDGLPPEEYEDRQVKPTTAIATVDDSDEVDLASIAQDDSGISLSPAETERILIEALPYHGDQKKARYLAFRSCGFSFREACQLVPVHEGSVKRWRSLDPYFKSIEDKVPQLRKETPTKYMFLDFTRNYRAFLERDFILIMKAMSNEPLTPQEHSYLMKARGHYTPANLEALNRLQSINPMDMSKGKNGFNFTDFLRQLAIESGDATVRAAIEVKRGGN